MAADGVVIYFEGHRFAVMPATRETSASIHIDLHNERINDATAYTLPNQVSTAWRVVGKQRLIF